MLRFSSSNTPLGVIQLRRLVKKKTGSRPQNSRSSIRLYYQPFLSRAGCRITDGRNSLQHHHFLAYDRPACLNLIEINAGC